MKKIFPILLSLTLIFTPILNCFADVNIEINQVPINFSDASGTPFVDEQNRTQVPFRATMEGFGAIVEWDDKNKVAIAEKNGIKVEIPIGSNYIIKNGKRIQNDTVSQIKDNRTYLPIRAVLEAFGAKVSWNNITQTVIATTSNALSDITAFLPTAYGSENGNLFVHFIDVGQGDSILIDYNDYEILIDAGPNASAKTVVDYITPYIDDELDVIVATHEHADHIGGMSLVLDNFDVGKIIDNGVTSTTKTYNNYITRVHNENAEYINATSMQNISLFIDDGISYKILQMLGAEESGNNASLVSLLEYNDINILFMGDAECELELNNLDSFCDIDVLKAAHHGSSTSSSKEFLTKVSPENIIIFAGKDNSYGHPHKAAFKRLSDTNAKIYVTSEVGTVVLTTDGKTYELYTKASIN